MVVDDIFQAISQQQTKGLMLHSDMADYFDFLSLKGFKRLHEYQYLDESIERRKVHRYLINHYDVLVPEDRVDYTSVIPNEWQSVNRADVDTATKQESIRVGMDKWIEHEVETQELYADMCMRLLNMNQVAAAEFIEDLVVDVAEELKCAKRLRLDIVACGCDMDYILSIQDEFHEKYRRKMKRLKL